MQTVRAASKEFENLQKNVFQGLKTGTFTRKNESKEKDEVLEKFRIG